MIEYKDLVQNNSQFLDVCSQEINCNSFLFESNDEVYLQNFAYSYAQFLFCTNKQNKPCNNCISCQKVSLLKHADLTIYPKNGKTILVDDVKDLINNVNLTPIESDKKVFVFNNFSQATPQAQNKLLKILEEPPKNTYIILCVTNINTVLATILSRCKKIRLKPLKNEELNSVLNSTISQQNALAELNIAQGNLTKLLNYSSNSMFITTYNNVFKTLLELKDSKKLIKYSCLFNATKTTFEMSLEIFESVFRDIILLRLNKQNLVKNTANLTQLIDVSKDFNCDMADLIIKKIYAIKKQLTFNCNYVLLVDNFLLYVLEVKFLCNKK